MADTVVTLSGDDTKLLAALRRITGQQDEVDKGFTKTKKSSEEAAKQAERDAKRIENLYKSQTDALRLQQEEIKNGSSAAAEMKAIQQGISQENAAQIRQLHEQVQLERNAQRESAKAEENATRLRTLYKSQTDALELQLVAHKKGNAAAVEMKAIQQGLTKEQATHLRQLQQRVDLEVKSSKESSQGINKLVDGVAKWAAGYATVTTAIGVLNGAIASQIELNDKVVESFDRVAKAQQEAAKNLAGVSPEKISAALQQEIPKIAIEARFKDLPGLTKALGSTASIVGEERASSVVATAAKLERLTPENLQTTATSTGDLVKATGVKDAREAMALLLSAGSVARPEELGKLSLGASRAVNAGTLAAPGQDKVAAAKESTALFAMLSSVDKSGESASTATVQLIAQLSEMFKDSPDDPGTTMGRLQAVRSDPEKKEAFLSDLKGEAIFKPLFKALTDEASTQSAELATALKTITTDIKVFDAALKTLNITPQQKVANARAEADTAIEVQKFGDAPRAATGNIRQIYSEAMANTNVSISQYLAELIKSPSVGLSEAFDSPDKFARESIDDLQLRRLQLQKLPTSSINDDKLQVVDRAIKAITELRAVAIAPRDFPSPQLEEQNKLTAENNKLLGEISRKLDARPNPAAPPPPVTDTLQNALKAGRP